MDILLEFEKQSQNLIEKAYPKAAGLSDQAFLQLLEPLKGKLHNLNLPDIDHTNGFLPFVIVVKSELVSTQKAMAAVKKDGKPGITKLFPLKPADFNPLPVVNIPNEQVYLLLDIDRGKSSLNLPPRQALENILQNDRSPLTIDEGVALVTQYPEFLIKNNCFSLVASRHAGDKRVPAIWINASKNPNLGWCWDGNPHTWLGSASAKYRLSS